MVRKSLGRQPMRVQVPPSAPVQSNSRTVQGKLDQRNEMDTNVPYMPSVTNLSKILDAIQRAGVPDVFNLDFLKDLGFTSSNDRPVIKVLKYLGMLDTAGHPQTPYREFVDHTKAKAVLAERLRVAFDDLFLSDQDANKKAVEQLKGWFKTKTGASDSVAKKMSTQFKALANYADFESVRPATPKTPEAAVANEDDASVAEAPPPPISAENDGKSPLGLGPVDNYRAAMIAATRLKFAA